MKTIIESAGGVASRVKIGNHDVVFDQAAPVPGGEDRGPSPLDAMAVAVGACAHYYAAAFLFGRRIPTDGLRVEMSFEKTKDPVPRIGRLDLRVVLPPGIPAPYLAAIERAVRHCPAYGTLQHPPQVTLVVDAPEGSVTAA
jgi:uncharacterized OsmC-like protein